MMTFKVWWGVLALAFFVGLACSLPSPKLPEGIQPLIDDLGFELEEELVDGFIILTPRPTSTPTLTPTMTLTPTAIAIASPISATTTSPFTQTTFGTATFTPTPTLTPTLTSARPTPPPTPRPTQDPNSLLTLTPALPSPTVPGSPTPIPVTVTPTAPPPPPDDEQGGGSDPIVTLFVNTADDIDDGTCSVMHCSLREAIVRANSIGLTQGVIISFQIPGSGVQTIRPAPGLPAATRPMTIDAASQPGANCGSWPPTLQVELDGSAAGAGTNGLTIVGGNTTVQGFVINRFGSNGIFLGSSGSNQIRCNFIGTDVSGATTLPNSLSGIIIANGSTGNVIGGGAIQNRNLLSGNGQHGIFISGTGVNNNQIALNYIGTDVNGANALPNAGAGVAVANSAANNLIGVTGQGNIISGNNGPGVYLSSSADSNQVVANLIGISSNGTTALSNAQAGVLLNGGASNNVIGGTVAGARNYISGNGGPGVSLIGVTANTIQGNYIGVNFSGLTALANATAGINIDGSASLNSIGGTNAGARNIISGNPIGIRINDSTLTAVAGNYIGTNTTGLVGLANTTDGVLISGNSSQNVIGAVTNITIGGPCTGACNLISGNGGRGIRIDGSGGATNNRIYSNYIGTDVNGTAFLANGQSGITLSGGTTNNAIGLAVAGGGNLISGNTINGIAINNASSNQVVGNMIGTNASGTAALPNSVNGLTIDTGSTNNTIGGTSPEARNLISGNSQNGILLRDAATSANTILGNYIGSDAAGSGDVGNLLQGILLENAPNNIIGGSNTTPGGICSGACNLISGNDGDGVQLTGTTTSITIQGNYIGTDVNGTAVLGNGSRGVAVNGVSNNIIGGDTTALRNVISSNGLQGVILTSGATNNQILGNHIGTDVAGTLDLGNGSNGVLVETGATDNFIGRTTAGSGNRIAYNTNGIRNDGSNSTLAFSTVISNSDTVPGGGIHNTSTLTITASTIEANGTTVNGGGIYNTNIITMSNGSIVTRNTAGTDGGGIWNNGAISIATGSTANNIATGNGGGVYNEAGGTVRLTGNSILSTNQATNGGGIYNTGAGTSLDIDNGTLLSNQASLAGGNGGGIYNEAGGSVRLTTSSVLNTNQATNGGGIYNTGAGTSLDIDSGTLLNNTATAVGGSGGGVYNNSTASTTIVGSTIQANSVNSSGGGIFIDSGTVAVTNTTIISNVSSTNGGGVASQGGSILNLTLSTIEGNIANQAGGGLYNLDNATNTSILSSTLRSNIATNGFGGGVHNEDGQVGIVDSTLSYNQAITGAGISNSSAVGTPITLITNTTVSTNVAGSHGGGVYNANTLLLAYSTVTSNTTTSGLNGGGIHAEAGNIDVSHTIIANSLAGGDCTTGAGTVTSVGFNLVETVGLCVFAAAGDLTAVDPNLGPLQMNGGTTKTHELLLLPAASPAIDQAPTAGCPAADQRGTGRGNDIIGAGNDGGANLCDIGAYER